MYVSIIVTYTFSRPRELFREARKKINNINYSLCQVAMLINILSQIHGNPRRVFFTALLGKLDEVGKSGM